MHLMMSVCAGAEAERSARGGGGGGKPAVREYEVEGVSYEPKGAIKGLESASVKGGGFEAFAQCATLCNDAERSC